MVALSKIASGLEHSPTLWLNEKVLEKRKSGETVYHFGFGQSPFPAPERLKLALAAQAHRKEYLPSAGLAELRAAVAGYFQDKIGKDYTDEIDVIVAPGSKLILYSLQMAIAGDLLMAVPSWVSYAPHARMVGSAVIPVPVTLDDEGYHIDCDVFRDVIRKARAAGQNPSKIILNAPNNPTGLCIPEDELRQIAKVCDEEDIFIISDEIYGEVKFDGTYSSVAKYAPHRTAVSTGLSKHLSLGGWRVGVGLIPKACKGLAQAMTQIASETWSCVPTPIQKASIVAYAGHEDITRHVTDSAAIHGLMNQTVAKALKDAGVNCPVPQGAFYTYPDFTSFADALKAKGIHDSVRLQEHLIEKYNIATLPGIAFGEAPETLTLRLSACDYDGAAALEAYQAGETLDEAFIRHHAPNVAKAIERFQEFSDRLALARTG